MGKQFCGLVLLLFAALFFARPANALVQGQIDNFEDGTTMGWSNGVPGALVNIVPAGRPALTTTTSNSPLTASGPAAV